LDDYQFRRDRALIQIKVSLPWLLFDATASTRCRPKNPSNLNNGAKIFESWRRSRRRLCARTFPKIA
ncbi:hypothetical protein OS035_33065, partial [Rhizobium sp. 268]|uniref:hypothetical protein n=1 Tax=Rhizobium sp. 268 TaxID=2996375 RepID=UPI002F92F37F